MARCRAARALLLAALLAATSLAAVVPTASAATASDEARLPAAMVGSSAVHLDGKTYIFGGRLVDGTFSDRIYEYDHATSGITEAGHLPNVGTDPGARQAGTAAALNGKIYYFGGAVYSGADVNGDGVKESVPRSVAQVVEFDPATRAVRTVGNMEQAAWGLSAAAMGGKIYLFGGFFFDLTQAADIKRLDKIQEFDGERVRSIGRLPYALQDAGATSLNGRVYIFGGLADHDAADNPCPTYEYYNQETGQNEEAQPTACLVDHVLSYNPTSGVATPIAKLPYRAQFLNAAVVNGKAYVSGGALPGPTATASIVEFDPSTGSPIRVLSPTLPRATFGAPATTDGNIITLFGGRMGGQSDLSDVIVAFDPRPTAPWAPRGLAVETSTNSIALTWEPPAYDGGSAVSTYRVYRTAANGGEELLANVTGTLEYRDASAQPGTEYAYRVTAVNSAGESDPGARIDTKAQETVPGVVDSLEVFTANKELVLRWLPPTQNGGLDIKGYRIYRDDMQNPFTTVVAGVSEFRDTGLTNGQDYTYAVRAYNAKGDGPLSPPVTRAPAAVPETPASSTVESIPSGGVRITWDDPAVGAADGFVLYRGTEPKHLAEIARTNERLYEDQDVQLGRTYYYAVTAYNEQGESPPTELKSVSLVTPPGPPAQLIVSPGQGEIRLTWQQPTDLGGADPATIKYYVTRSDASSPTGRIIATDLKGTTYTDRPLQPGRTYAYTITAMNPLEGEATDSKSATVKEIVNEAPRAVIAALPAVADAGVTVELDASQSLDADGTIVSYVFDFGDGSSRVTTDAPSVEHAYAANGTYYPSVVVTDNRNQRSEVAMTQVIIGQSAGPLGEDQTGLGTIPGRDGTTTPNSKDRPGTQTPTPGPGAALVGLALVGAALLAARRRRE